MSRTRFQLSGSLTCLAVLRLGNLGMASENIKGTKGDSVCTFASSHPSWACSATFPAWNLSEHIRGGLKPWSKG